MPEEAPVIRMVMPARREVEVDVVDVDVDVDMAVRMVVAMGGGVRELGPMRRRM